MFEIIQLCLTYAAMHKFCACYGDGGSQKMLKKNTWVRLSHQRYADKADRYGRF